MNISDDIKSPKPGGFVASNLKSFIEGVRDNIEITNIVKNKEKSSSFEKDSNEMIQKVFSSGNVNNIFAMTYYFNSVVPNIESYSKSVQIASKMGTALRDDTKLTEYDLGTLYEPIEIRAFLKSMEHYDFKTAPDFLEKVLNVLPSEGDSVVYEYIAQNPQSASRLIKNLIDVDNTKGTQYAIHFMARKSVPDKLFSYFTHLCIKNNRFSKNTLPLIKNESNIPLLRKLISQSPNQFNNVIDICAELGITDLSKENSIWDALQEISPITPGVYAKYRTLDGKEKIEFKKWLESFDYSRFFKNESISIDNLPEEDRNVMVDLMYRAYNPVNMSFAKVKELVSAVPDRTQDLKEYIIQDKYPVEFKTVSFELKKGESLNPETISKVKSFFEVPKKSLEIQEPLLRLARATTDFTHEEVVSLFSLMQDFDQVKNQQNTWSASELEESPGMKTFRALGSSKEMFSIFTQDNLPSAITLYLGKDLKFKERLEKILARPERRVNLLKALGYQEDNEFTKEFTELELMAQVFSDKVLSKYVVMSNKELRKYTKSEDTTSASISADMYISKNQGSFFSKAAAGLCTAQDIELWNNPNHFHVNVVNEDNQIKGLTMAYIETINDKKSVVLRGFNPTVQYLESTSPVSFVEESIKVAREFMEDNNIEDLYIIDSTGDRLSNRPTIVSYVSAYISDMEKIPHEMFIAGGSKVQAVRKVPKE